MSWKSIAPNQTISRANLQNAVDTGVFIQRNGVPVTETNREITKANAQDYVYTWDLYPPFSNKTSNQLPVKSNLAVQSMQFFATTDTYNNYLRLYVGNNNRSWFYQIWQSNLNNVNDIAAIASSTDGSCITFGRYGPNNGSFFTSNTYGELFNLRTDIIGLGDAVTGVAMSDTGQYQIVTRQKSSSGGSLTMKIFKSSNYGITWSTVYDSAGVEYYVFGAAMSGNGTYSSVVACNYLGVYGTSYYVFYSSGGTYTRTFLCYGLPYNSGSGVCIDMSKSGQYQLAAPISPTNGSGGTSLNIFFLSTDYGSTWSTINTPSIPYLITKFTGCTVSAGGDYMSVSGIVLGTGSYIFTSSDFGVTWTTAVIFYTGSGSIAYINSDRSGQFQYAYFDYSNLNYSDSYGQSPWNPLSLPLGTLKAISVAAVTGTTPYIYGLLTGSNIPLYSKTTGVSGAAYNNVGVLTAGTYNYIAASGNSNNGKYVLVVSNNASGYSYLFKSSDYGVTFTTLNTFGSPNEFKCCSISDNGQYIVAVAYFSPTNTSTITSSTDGGVSFNYPATQTGTPKNCDISGDGKYSTIVFNDTASTTTRTMSSSDYSSTFPTYHFFNGRVAGDICMSNAGRYRTVTMTDTANVSIMHRSTNYGISWDLDIRIGYGFWDYVACDNSGQVQIIIQNNYNTITGSVIYTTDRWATVGTYYPNNIELIPQLIGGVNISNDGTYWSFVTTDGYSYVSTNAGASWSGTNLGYTYTFKLLSK
jgi:hypothetical protein